MVETIQNFLTLPELPDIIAYFIILIMLIGEGFLKKFVQKDNRITLNKVNTKTNELTEIKKEFEKEKKELEKERKQIKKEIAILKNAIKQTSNNTHELVSNGTANEISKMLEEKDDNIEEEVNVQ